MVESTTVDRILAEIDALPPEWHEEGSVGTAVTRALARHGGMQTINHSVETGTGKTTLLLSHLSRDHTVFAIGGNADSFQKVLGHGSLNRANVTFIEGPSQITLPLHSFKQPLDFAMLDGPHGYPFPDLEYYYVYPHLATGALLVVDDIHIPTIFNLYSFLCEDAMFRLVEVVETTAFFRRTAAPTLSPVGDYWWIQNYNSSRFPLTVHDPSRRSD